MAKGSSSMDPMTAGVMVGGQFLANYFAQKAAEEENKRKLNAQIYQQYGQDQSAALQGLANTYQQALLG